MPSPQSTITKAERLHRLSTPNGVIAALAMDQRKSLRRMISEAAGKPLEAISDRQLTEFKSAVTKVLTRDTSAILLDPEYGLDAVPERAESCGLLMTYESDGYENPRPHRMLALMPQYSVRRLRDLGGDAIKILLSYTPLEDAAANDDKQVLIERIGDECAALQMPFFLEPVVYDPAGADVKSFEFLTTKPELVVRTVEEFSKARYNVDVLKIEFPVHAALVEGSSVYAGRRGYSMDEALNWFREVDRAAQIPYIFLSAGISGVEFVASLELAIAAQARFSGVLCGRANWQDGVPVFANNGRAAFEEWLRFSGSNNIRAVNECLRHATAWYDVKR